MLNNSLPIYSSIRRASSVIFLTLITAAATAQAPHALSTAEQQKVEALLQKMTLEQKIDYLGGTGFGLRAVPSLGIPALNMSDGPYGTRSNSGFPSTTYGAGVGMAASWDRALAARVGGGIGRDARARGVHFMLGPGVNIYRSPMNGRNFEYFGEDPFLSGQMAANYITGMQAQGVSATVKHYLGNNSEFLRHDSNTIVDERTAREIYLPQFEAAVKQGHVTAVMDSYNLINGQHATENSHFNIDILRKDWGFTGILMSDWDATYDGVAAANGGMDVEEPSGKFMNPATLLPAIKAGKVSEATIDEKVRRVLSVAASYGWLDRDQQDRSIAYIDGKNDAVALDSAREGVVLLKNQGNLLPLSKSIKAILVVGPNAYPGVPVAGGSAGVVPFQLTSGFQGISKLVGSTAKVLYTAGLPTLTHLANATDFSTALENGKRGLTLETFNNAALSGSPKSTSIIPHATLEGLTFKLLVANLDSLLPLLSESGSVEVSHRMTGYYNASAAGKYILTLESSGENNGNRVFVDGKNVIDNWLIVRAFQPHVTLDLSAGPHKIVIEEMQMSPVGGHLLFAIVPQDQIVEADVAKLAKMADVVIVEAGYQQESESEGGDRTFSLPFGQDELIQAVVAANPKTIVAITAGGNVDSSMWIDRVPAYLQAWYAGQAGGRALAEILFGDVNPSGHLPDTFERRVADNPTYANYYPVEGSKDVEYKEGIFVGYRGYEKNKVEPLFPFGFGLSYTTFRFSNLKVSQTSQGGELKVVATFNVTNTGTRKGAEVAQLYVTEDAPKVARPMHELKGFDRVELAAGETKHLSIPLDARSFSYYDVAAKKWTIGTSKFTISVGDSIQSLPLKSPLTLTVAAN